MRWAALLTALVALLVYPALTRAHFGVESFESAVHGATSMQFENAAVQFTGRLAVQDGEVLYGPGAGYRA